MHGDEADRGVAHALQLDVLDDVARADQLDAGGRHAERAIGLDHRGGMITGRHEHEHHVRLLVLGALEERREVRHLTGAAGRNGVDHPAAIGLERVLERREAVFAGRIIGIGDHRGLGVQLLGRCGAERVARMPHGERGAHVVARQVGNERGRRVHDHRELLAGIDHGRGGDGVGRIDPAGKRVDLVLGQQFLGGDLGGGAVRRLGIALHQRDRIGLHLISIELEIKLHAALDLLGKLGADAGKRQNDADFHFLRRSGLRHGQAGRDGGCGNGRDHSFGHQKPSQVLRFNVLRFNVLRFD